MECSTEKLVQKCERCSLRSALRSGRPAEVFETHIKVIIFSDRHSTTHDIAEKLKMAVGEGSCNFKLWSRGEYNTRAGTLLLHPLMYGLQKMKCSVTLHRVLVAPEFNSFEFTSMCDYPLIVAT
ncbi:hypothetical protein TNCV_4095391 [Trichonephila clavipes]|uniref:Uncharacterized protein n=1 Tax=Trichonephila clavipes TaxID=2585209 RepID=A0A8X6VCM2_TRICX|nr:hypothetical protein TNCV_4095391 [Trichonephila clavipes]